MKPNPPKSWRKWKPKGLRSALHSHKLTITMPLVFLLAACSWQTGSPGAYFIPPTLASTAAAIPLVTQTPTPPSPTPACTNSLQFIEDITVPDGSAFAPGAMIDKRWRVLNDGTCNWDSFYRLRFVTGDPMGAEEEQALFPARSGSEAEIRVVFTAPSAPGLYRSTWQAYTPDGEPFGELIFVEILVDFRAQPQASPSPTAETNE